MVVSVSFIARVLDLTERQIQSLASQGVVPRAEHGKYPLAQTLQAYVRFIKTGARSVAGDDADGVEDPEVPRGEREAAKSYNVERARLTHYKAEIQRLELAHRRAELVAVADVAAIVGDEYANVRSRMLSIAPRVSIRLVGEQDAGVIQDRLLDEIGAALTALSDAPAVATLAVERSSIKPADDAEMDNPQEPDADADDD